MAERTWEHDPKGTLVPALTTAREALASMGTVEVIDLAPAAWAERRAPAPRASTWQRTERPFDPARPEPGARLGPFELVRRLGEGSTGSVWEAVDRRIDAPVALKLFEPVRGAPPIGRVMAEARAASRVVSEHVVYVREAGEIDGTSYLAMALCREESASDAAPLVARPLTEETPRSLAEAVAWGEQIARGVAAAHAAGVFHRDLKPDNVLVLPASRGVRIVDFGLSPTSGGGDDGSGPLLVPSGARGDVLAGTPAYMAPEQARGFRRAPDPARDAEALAAIDVYGIGATLWAVLVGRAPHAGEDGEPVERVRARAAAGEVAALDMAGARFRVPARLARIVARALAADPADRYASAADLAVDLARFRAGLPTSLDAPLAPVRAWLWARRNPARIVAATWAAALLVGLGAAGGVYGRLETARAELARVEAAREAAAAMATAEAAHAEEEERRADAAADAAFASALRAESAEEHAAHLRRYAKDALARAEEADAAAKRAAELAAAAEAAAEAARVAEAEARAAEAEARGGEAVARAAESAARLAEVRARADAEAAGRAAAEARADAAVEKRAAEEARAAAEAAGRAASEARAAERATRADVERARGEAQARVDVAEQARAAAERRAAAAETRAAEAEARLRALGGAGDARDDGGAAPPGAAGGGVPVANAARAGLPAVEAPVADAAE